VPPHRVRSPPGVLFEEWRNSARRAYELGEDIDDPSAVREKLLRLWLQDLTTTIGELGMELQQMSEQIEAMEAEEGPEERALR
jgi:hypothetical protein